jgi:hypothetical protein
MRAKQATYDQSVRVALLLRHGPSIDVDCALNFGVSEQFLMYFEIDMRTPQQGRIGSTSSPPPGQLIAASG